MNKNDNYWKRLAVHLRGLKILTNMKFKFNLQSKEAEEVSLTRQIFS